MLQRNFHRRSFRRRNPRLQWTSCRIFTAAKMECHGYFNRADRNQHTVEVKILMPPKSGIFVTVVVKATFDMAIAGTHNYGSVRSIVPTGPRVPVRATFDMATAGTHNYHPTQNDYMHYIV